jgi:hypothetical protein
VRENLLWTGALALPAAAVLLIVVSIGGCFSPPDLEPIVDLVEALPRAQVSAERDLVDLGTPEGGSHLVAGWSWREKSRDGTTFVWSSGRRSVVEFFVADPGTLGSDLEVQARCLAFPFPDGLAQTVTVSVGETLVSTFEVPAGWREMSFQLLGVRAIPG